MWEYATKNRMKPIGAKTQNNRLLSKNWIERYCRGQKRNRELYLGSMVWETNQEIVAYLSLPFNQDRREIIAQFRVLAAPNTSTKDREMGRT